AESTRGKTEGFLPWRIALVGLGLALLILLQELPLEQAAWVVRNPPQPLFLALAQRLFSNRHRGFSLGLTVRLLIRWLSIGRLFIFALIRRFRFRRSLTGLVLTVRVLLFLVFLLLVLITILVV